MTSPNEHLEVFEANIHEALKHYHTRKGTPDLVYAQMPFDEMLAAEEDEQGQSADADAMAQRRAACRVMFRFFLAEGQHPAKILKRVFALGRGLRLPFFSDLTMTEAAKMLGETKAAHSYRMKTLSGLVKLTGQHGFRFSGQKSSAATAAYSAAQQGNQNRKKKLSTNTKKP